MYSIIIVDDEEFVRESIRHKLDWGSLGIQVAGVAENGLEALDLIRQNPPDIVLTDIRMPFMDGLELIKQISTSYKDIKLVIISGYDDFSYAQQAIKYGVSEYLLKPVKAEQMEEVFTRLVDFIMKRQMEREVSTGYIESLQALEEENLLCAILKREKLYTQDSQHLHHGLQEKVRGAFLEIAVFYLEMNNNTQMYEPEYDIISKFVREFWRKYRYSVIHSEDHWIVLIYDKTEIIKHKIISTFNIFKVELEEHLISLGRSNLKCTVGIGNVYTDLYDLCKSYSEALCARQYKFFIENEDIFFYEALAHKDFSVLYNKRIDSMLEDMVEKVFTNDNSAVGRNIKDFFYYIKDNGFIKIQDMQLKCIETVFSIYTKAKEVDIRLDAKNKKKVYEDVFAAKSFSELEDCFCRTMLEISYELHSVNANSTNNFVTRAKEYVLGHYDNKITLEKIAGVFYVHPVYFSTRFKKETGQNFIEYVNFIRINRAKELLKWSEYTVKDIACKVGYEDYTYFCKVFKKAEGVAPLVYRAQHLLKHTM